MNGMASLSATALALVLAWAAVAKGIRPRATTIEFRQLGLPLPGVLARLVPIIEVVVAILLVLTPGWGGVFAFALLAGFTTLLVSIIRSGRVVSCGCFGSTSNEPVSINEVTRNLVLLTLAAGAASITDLKRPALPETILFTTGLLLAALAVQLVAFYRTTGAFWRTELAGEAI
jgi:hypothetical protein